MLFLGLGTGLGSAMIVEGVLEPMEIAHLPYKKGRTYEDYLDCAESSDWERRSGGRHVTRPSRRSRTPSAQTTSWSAGKLQAVEEASTRDNG